MKSVLVYRHTCANCSSSYIGKTYHHFKTRIEERIKKDIKSHIFKHLHSTTTFFDLCNSLFLKIIDKANSKFDVKIKEPLHSSWRKPNLNTQQNHLALTLSLWLTLPLCSFLSLFFAVLLHLLFSLYLTLVVDIFYYLSYNLILLHLIITHLFVIDICSTQLLRLNIMI